MWGRDHHREELELHELEPADEDDGLEVDEELGARTAR